MGISTILQLINDYGPTVFMFAFGIWGIYTMVLKSRKDQTRTEKRNDEIIDHIVSALDKREDIKKRVHDEGTKRRKEVIYQCNTFAKEIMEKTDADKVTIYDYSNGTESLAGIPFLHFRNIAEKKSSVLTRHPIQEVLDINTLGVFLLDLEQEQVITIKNIKREEDKYPELNHFMGLQKQHKGIFANVVGLDSSLGFISVTFTHNKKVDYPMLEKLVYEYAQKVSNLLDNSNNNE